MKKIARFEMEADWDRLTEDGKLMVQEWASQALEIVRENNRIFNRVGIKPFVVVLMHPYAYGPNLILSNLTTQQKATSLKAGSYTLESNQWKITVKLCSNLPCTWIVYR